MTREFLLATVNQLPRQDGIGFSNLLYDGVVRLQCWVWVHHGGMPLTE